MVQMAPGRMWNLRPTPKWTGASKPQTLPGRSTCRLRGQTEAGLAAIFLDAGGTQAGQAVLVDGPLPAQELVDRERVALTGLLEAHQAAPDRGDHLCLAANDPPFGVPGRQIGDGKRT